MTWRLVCWTLVPAPLLSSPIWAAQPTTRPDGALGPPAARFDQLLAGSNGDARVQFIELRTAPGRRSGRIAGHLRFHDAAGDIRGEVSVPASRLPDYGRRPVLIATTTFAAQTGVTPEIFMPPLLPSADGMVCWHAADSRSEPECVPYGNYRGPCPDDACSGPPAPGLPIAGEAPLSLVHVDRARPLHATPFGNGEAYELRTAAVRDRYGRPVSLEARTIVEQGRRLFALETFAGNGRTCATCHEASDAFGLSPSTVADRFGAEPPDPLFVAEVEPALSSLENACLLREGDERALILENISGFDQPPVFRTAPHLRNIELTAPYGHSATSPDLQTFSLGAVEQHFPRTLARNTDPAVGPIDFRVPSPFELAALEAFMNTIRFPADGDLDLDRMIDAAVAEGRDRQSIERGSALFFGEVGSAQCSRCHAGPTLSEPDGSLGPRKKFDIGVDLRPANVDDGCAGGPGDPTAALPGDAAQFSVPPLVGVAGTAPFFHDNSADGLRDAVTHYTSIAFQFSPAAVFFELGTRIAISDDEVEDIVAFLEAISVDPTATAVAAISIEVEPLAASPFVNLASLAPVVVALRGGRTLQVGDLDVASLQLAPGGVGPEGHRVLDIDGDEALEVVVEFPLEGAGLAVGDTEICITGRLSAGPFEACGPALVGWFGCGRGVEAALSLVPVLMWRRYRRAAGTDDGARWRVA